MFKKRKRQPGASKKQESESSLLFVYGTLMQGLDNARFLQSPNRANYLGNAKIRGLIYDLGEFPGFVPQDRGLEGQEEHWVYGELYHLEDPTVLLDTLDIVEGVNPFYPERSLFVRKLLPAEYQGTETLAWVYVFNQPLDRFAIIPSGDFRRRRRYAGVAEAR